MTTRVLAASNLGAVKTFLTRFGIHPRPGVVRALAAVLPVVLAAYLVARGWLYPLWPGAIGALGHPFTPDPAFSGAWGGPTLAGAWAAHALIALGLQAVCLVVLRLLYRKPPAGRASTGTTRPAVPGRAPSPRH